jgi:hypothetical protein
MEYRPIREMGGHIWKLNHEHHRISKNTGTVPGAWACRVPSFSKSTRVFLFELKIFRCLQAPTQVSHLKSQGPPQASAPEIRIKRPNIKKRHKSRRHQSQLPLPELDSGQRGPSMGTQRCSECYTTKVSNRKGSPSSSPEPSTPITHGKSFTTDSSGRESE